MRLDADPPSLLDDLPPDEAPSTPVAIGSFRVDAWDERRIALLRPGRPGVAIALLVASAPLVAAGVFLLRFLEDKPLLAAAGALSLALAGLLHTKSAGALLPSPFVVDHSALVARRRRPLLAPRASLPLSAISRVEVQLTFTRGEVGGGFVRAALVVQGRDGGALAGPETEPTTVAGWRDSRDALLPLAREIGRRTGAPVAVVGKGLVPAALRS